MFNKYSVYKKIIYVCIIIFFVIFTVRFISHVCPVMASMPSPVNSQASFEDYLTRTGMPLYSKYSGYVANYEIYKNYKLISYGYPSNVPGNRYDSNTKQYEALGYSFDEYILYNSYFPEDYPSTSDPRYWNRIDIGADAIISWMRLTSRQKEHIKKATIFYMGKDYNSMTYSNLNLSENNSVVLAIPTLDLGFFLHTNHLDSSQKLRYATFHGQGIGDILITGNITAKDLNLNKTYIMKPEDDYLDINFTVNCSIEKYIGLARSSDIHSGGIKFLNYDTKTSGSGEKILNATKRYNRQNVTGLSAQTFSQRVSATIWYVSQMGDLKTKDIFLNFEIKEEPKINYDVNVNISMEGKINAFKNENTLLGYFLPENKLRFLCFEEVLVKVDFINSYIPSTIRLYPVGSRYIDLPVTRLSDNSGQVKYSYNIGHIESTLTWNNNRIRAPETLMVQMIVNNKLLTYNLHGIEITGSIHDLVYLQVE